MFSFSHERPCCVIDMNHGGVFVSVISNRNYSILLSGQLISTLGNNLYMLALPWYVYITTGSKELLVVTGLAQSLPALAGLFSGVFVDRWKKRTVMMVVDLLRLVLCAVLFFFAAHHDGIVWIVATVLLLELAGRFFGPAARSIIPLVVDKELLAEASGLEQSSSGIAQLAGTLGGGPIIQLLGAPVLFLLNSITYAISVISLLFVRVQEHIGPPTEPPSFFKEWKAGFRTTLKSRLVALVVFAAMAANFGFSAFDITLTAWVKGPMHGNAIYLALVGGSFFVGILVGGMLLGPINKKVEIRTILVGGLLIDALLVAVFGVDTNIFWSTSILLVMGIFTALMNGALGTFAYQVVPAKSRGRVFGIMGALSTMMTPVGMAVYGYLMLQVHLSILFVLVGIPALLGGIGLMLPFPVGSDDPEPAI